MSGPTHDVSVRLADGRVQIEHDCGERRSTATLNNADWRITSEDPLSVEPSVGCGDCGLHGWITSGEFWTSSASR